MTYLFPLHQFPFPLRKHATTHIVHRAQFVLRYKPSFNFFFTSLLSLEFTHAFSSACLTSRIKNAWYDIVHNPFLISQVYITHPFLMPQGRGWTLRGILLCCMMLTLGRYVCILRHSRPWTHISLVNYPAESGASSFRQGNRSTAKITVRQENWWTF